MEKKKTQTQWSNEYTAKAYDRISVVVAKGERNNIKEYATKKGMTVNRYITNLISADMGYSVLPTEKEAEQ